MELCEASGFDRRTIVYYIQQGLIPKAGRRGPNTRYPEDALLRLRFVRGIKDLQDRGRCGTVTLLQVRGMLGRLDTAAVRELLDRELPVDAVDALLAQGSPPADGSPDPPPVAAAAVAGAEPAAQAAAAPSPRPSLFSGPSPARPTVGDGRRYGLADAGIRNRAAQAAARPDAPSSGAPHPPVTPAVTMGSEDAPRPPAGPAPATPAGGAPAEAADVNPAQLGELLRELELRPAMGARRLAPGAAEQWTEIPITSRVYLSVRGLSEADAPLAEAVARGMKKLLRAR
jgi:hypothetical protein